MLYPPLLEVADARRLPLEAASVDLARRRVACCTIPMFPPGRLAVA